MNRAILVNKKVVLEPDLLKWANWFETAQRKVVSTIKDNVNVSTVFLGINHGYGPVEQLWFETMIFGGDHDGFQDRCATYNDALAMHDRACALAFQHPHSKH